MLYRACLSLLVILVLPVSTAARPATRYKPTPLQAAREKMSPAARGEAITADLAAITGPGISWYEIATKPYLSSIGGLCRRDVIVLSYRNDKPVGISSFYPQYVYLGLKDARSEDEWRRACTRLSGDKASWVTGPSNPSYSGSDQQIADAFWRLAITIEAVRKNPNLKVECTDEDGKPVTDLDCRAEFLNASSNISQIAPCYKPQGYCHGYWIGRWMVNIDGRAGEDQTTIIKITPDNSDIIIT